MKIIRADLQHISILTPIFNEYRVHFSQASDAKGVEIFVRERLAGNQAVIFMAVDDEVRTCMGFTLLYPMFSSLKLKPTLTLNDMYIGDDYRQFGIATSLLEAARGFGAETDAAWIKLKTGKDNAKACALYEKFGFEKDDECFYYYLRF